MQDPQRIVNVFIEGRVQGVGFRYWTEREARRLGLKGWVRNRYDGAVEAQFSGPSEAVSEMLKLCESGPAYSQVTKVFAVPEGGRPPSRFEIRATV